MFGSLLIGMRYLSSKNYQYIPSFRTLLCSLGIIISISILICITSVINGQKQEYFKTAIGINSHIDIHPIKGDNIKEANNIINVIEKSYGHLIDSIGLIIDGHGALVHNGNMITTIIRGSTTDYMRKKVSRITNFESNLLIKSGELSIGQGLSKKMNVKKGDNIILITHDKYNFTGEVVLTKKYKISEIMKSNIEEYDNFFTIMNLEDAKKTFSIEDCTAIEINLKTNDNIDKIISQMRNDLNKIDNNIIIYSWKDHIPYIIKTLNSQDKIAKLIIILFSFGSMVSIYIYFKMLVTSHEYTVATIRSMGVSKRFILISFIFAGLTIIIPSLLIGNIIGITLSSNIINIREAMILINFHGLTDAIIYFLDELPSIISYQDIITINWISMIFGLFAILFPAIQASNHDIVNVLKYRA